MAQLGGEASAADRATWTLAAPPRQAVPSLRELLRPVPVLAPRRISRLLADLDADDFQVRERATLELENLGELAESALRGAMAGRLSLEARWRMEHLLGKQEEAHPTCAELRSLRALEVLERAGTPEARRLLGELAKGAPEAWLTREAKAALERLAEQPGGR